MRSIEIVTKNYEETQQIAYKLSKTLTAGDIILLNGNLGAGKTTFVKGLARGLEIKETIKSPTFNIVKCYFNATIPFFHIDAYRLEGEKHDIGLDEYIEGEGICAIEWPNFIDYLLPDDCINIEIIGEGDSFRKIIIQGNEEQISRIEKGVM